MPDQEEVDRFLPAYVPFATLHPDRVVSMGTLGMPEIYAEAQKSKDVAIVNSIKMIREVWKEWEAQFGRKYEPIQSYRTEDADVALVTMGSMGETAEIAVDELRKQGVKAGLLKIKLWRPFPFDDLKKAVRSIRVLAVADRAVSFGGPGGPVFSEIRSALYDEPVRPAIVNYIIGLGGRDVQVKDFIAMVSGAATGKLSEPYVFYGVRG
jgi:pyruvate ferredoxin oxidoreductase alpha subunit